MSFSNSAEDSVLKQIFKGIALPWDANTDLYLALYTADPAEAGTAVTNEASYTGYARVAVNRTTGFTVSAPNLTNTNLVQFPLCSGGTNIITHVGIVDTASGAGVLIVSGELNGTYSISSGYQPQFNANALVFTLD